MNNLPMLEVEDLTVHFPTGRRGEAVKAVVELKPGQVLDEDAVLALCREQKLLVARWAAAHGQHARSRGRPLPQPAGLRH